MPHLTSAVEIGDSVANALVEAAMDLLGDEGPSARADITAPDVLLDLCAQYVVNTMRQYGQWDEDTLAVEYLKQMRAEDWSTIRQVAARPRRGSRRAHRMFLCLTDAALSRRDAPPLGQARAFLVTLGAYLRGGLGIGSASVRPLTLVLSHRDLRRIGLDIESSAHRALERGALREHLDSERLRGGPDMQTAWRVAVLGIAIARRGAMGVARARGEGSVSLGSHEQALGEVRDHLLHRGALWGALAKTSLIRDIAERFLGRPGAIPTLAG